MLPLAQEGEVGAVELLRDFHPSPPASPTRADVEFAVARSYGFESWSKLGSYLETATALSRNPHQQPIGGPINSAEERVDEFLRLACLNYGSDDPVRIERAREMLAEHPELASATIHTVAAVGDVAASRDLLADNPSLAREEGGPFQWEPLLYLAYSRIDSTNPAHSTLAVARLLVDAGADPNAGYLWEAEYPFTALTGAFGNGESGPHRTPPHQYEHELATLLLAAGADANDSQTVYNRHFLPDDTHLELLLRHGLGQGTVTTWHARLGLDHPTPQEIVTEELRWSAADGRVARVRLLLGHVDDVDGIGTDHPLAEGRTAHTLAVLNGNPEIASQLAQAGATIEDLTPAEHLRAACMRADQATVDVLLAADLTLAAQLIEQKPDLIGKAAELGRIDAVHVMAGLGFDLNPTGCRTPLHEAALNGNLELIRALLDLGADPASRDPEHDSSPQGWAEYNHQDEAARYLASVTSAGE